MGSPERATKQVDHLKLDQSTPRSESANQDAFLGRSNDIRYLVHWVVAAYLLFDTDCTGSISKDNVKQMQTQREIGDGSDVFLNEDRWQELDWDHNGVVDFEEFVFAFSEWIRDFDDE
jgi:calcium-binding protein CML